MRAILLILAIPLIEIGLFVIIGGVIGVWATLAWVLASAALALWILRRVGVKGAVTLRKDMAEMRDPLSPIAHRVMVVVAATLLLLPGFFTDMAGFLLLLKPVRGALIRVIARKFRNAPPPMAADALVIDGDWQDLDAQGPDQSDRPSGWTRH